MEEVVTRKLGRVAANEVELAYETFGDPHDSPIVLVMGLGTQMIGWPDEMCEGLGQPIFISWFGSTIATSAGSTHLHDVPAPRLIDVLLQRRQPPYRDRGHGRRRGWPSRCPGTDRRPSGGGVDGRLHRPDRRPGACGSSPLAHADDDVDGLSNGRAARPPGLRPHAEAAGGLR